MEEPQIYTTAQAAKLLGVTESSLRSRKSREKDILLEGEHWIHQEGSTFWTIAGILAVADRIDPALAQRLTPHLATMSAADPATMSAADPATVSAAIALDLSFLDPFLEATGQSLALEFYRRLPNYVMQHIQRMAIAPTPDERQVIEAAFQPVRALALEVSECPS